MRLRMAVTLAVVAAMLFVAAPAGAEPPTGEAWYAEAMNLSRAQDMATGDGVVVGVVDTGVDADHPDLAGRVLEGATITADGARSGGDRDLDGHGTAMAGLIAGGGGDDDPLIGVAPEAKILPVRIDRGDDGTLDQDLVYQGVRWAIDNGATVINLSLAGRPTVDDGWKHDLLDYAIEHDTVMVAAVGNKRDTHDEVGEPASIPGVIAVSGMGKDGGLWPGSVTGDSVVLCAPAEDVPHIRRGGDVQPASGTSAAAALVSGTAALIEARYPKASAGDVINRLIYTATDVGASGRDPVFGYGAVDAYAALSAVVAPNDEYYPLDLPTDVPQQAQPKADLGGWWLAVPAGLTAVTGSGVVLWMIRRGRGRHLLPAEETDAS